MARYFPDSIRMYRGKYHVGNSTNPVLRCQYGRSFLSLLITDLP